MHPPHPPLPDSKSIQYACWRESGDATYQLDARIDGMEEGARAVDELADGRGRGAGDEPEHLLGARRRPGACRGARDPLHPLCRCRRRGAVPARGRGRRGADEQGDAAAPPPRTGFRREREPAGRGLRCGERERERVERAEVDGGSHRMGRAWRRRPEPRHEAI